MFALVCAPARPDCAGPDASATASLAKTLALLPMPACTGRWARWPTKKLKRWIMVSGRVVHLVRAYPYRRRPNPRGLRKEALPMYYLDRFDAGRVLASRLMAYADQPNVIVLALPR